MFAILFEYNRKLGGTQRRQELGQRRASGQRACTRLRPNSLKGELMKQRWWKKKLTLMLIADANRRIVRLKLPEISLLAVPTALLAAVAGTALTFVVLHDRFQSSKQAMLMNFDGKQKQLEQTIADKDAELELLQTSLIALTKQAEQFQSKVDEIKQLKQVLDVMTGDADSGKPAGSTAQQRSGQTTGSPTAGVPLSMGGEFTPPSHAEVAMTVLSTKQHLSEMLGDMNVLMDSLAESDAKLQEAEHARNITPTLWPTPSHTVTSGFGIRSDPFTGSPAMHTGIDFSGKPNDPVYAAAEGTVIEAGYDDQHGNHIVIRHGRGIDTEYMHLSQMLVKRGQTVSKGQLIGRMGSTGRSTGTHLHYEVHRNGTPVDPRPYLLSNRKEEVSP